MANPRIPALRSSPPTGRGALDTTTLREFGGGWNVIDNDLSLNPEYSTILDNMWRRPDGSLSVRYGTELFADISGAVNSATKIINIDQFQNAIVAVCDSGEVVAVDGTGSATLKWDHEIANAIASDGDWAQSTSYTIDDVIRDPDLDSYWKCLVDHTSAGSGTFADDRAANPTYWEAAEEGWSTTDFASFAQFRGQLVICNGIDKPLLMDFDETNECQYLADLASGSNINTPIGRYVIAARDFVVMAGVPDNEATIYISNQGTSGTWVGDGAPNDAVEVDVSGIVPGNNTAINGLSLFRDKVVIGFDTAMLIGTLGSYNDSGDHVPTLDDVISAHGCLSHRTMMNLGDDMLFLDNVGVPSLTRTLLTDTIRPERPSELVDPAIQRNLGQLTVGTLTTNTFAIYDLLAKHYILFVPNHDGKNYDLGDDPFVVGEVDDSNTNYILVVYLQDHGLDEGDSVTISGATGFNSIQAATLNDTHIVFTVIDDDFFTIEVTDVELDTLGDYEGGGNSVVLSAAQTETTGYVYHSNVTQSRRKRRVWSRFRSWNWSCGCRTALGNIFFGRTDTLKIYRYGNDQARMQQDYIDDSPVDIDFVWELPWAAFNARFNTKRWRYLGFDTRGRARFTVKTFVDNIYKDNLGRQLPNNEADFVAGDTPGYGVGSQSYGGGRNTRNERNVAWPLKAKLIKVRVEGSSDKAMRIIAIIVGYLRGSITP